MLGGRLWSLEGRHLTDLGLKAVIWGALAFCYFLSWRSRRRREMGLCCACGTKPATQVLALDSFCDACARKTAHTYRVGSQFFAFLLAFMVIMFAWMWLEPGSDEHSLPWGRFAAALFGMAAFVVWLRRSPAKIDTTR